MSFTVKGIRQIVIILKTNYYFSALLLIITAMITISGHDILFQSDVELYGPLANNLRLMLLYLAIIEIAIVSYCCIRNQYQEIIFLGGFLILLIGSLEFYCQTNQLTIDSAYRAFFTYIGLSHIAFGLFTQTQQKQ